MKKVMYLSVFFLFNLIQVFAQGNYTLDLRVDEEANHVDDPDKEMDVILKADLYLDDSLLNPQSNYKYEFYRRYILESNPQWIMYGTSPQWGNNQQGTHPYQDSTHVPQGKFEIKCKITLPDGTIVNSDIVTIPWYTVIPNQKKSNGSSFGSVNYWYKGNFRDNNGLEEVCIPRYGAKILEAESDIESSQKFYSWQKESQSETYTNFNKFTLDKLTRTSMTSQFNYTYNATIRAKVDDYYLDVIKFKDPWFRDFNEAPYGIRNRGLDAEPEPLSNVVNNLSVSSNHQGVLLNQQVVSGQPYYSIEIPSSISVNGTSHQVYLQNWSSTGATLQYPNSLNTGVVFNSTSGATITANLKGSLLTDNSSAYNNGSQRKFVYDKGGYFHVSVYESMGKIWLEGSYDAGETWQLLNNGNPLNGNTIATNPSINDAADNMVAVVYQENNDIRINIVSLNMPDANPIKYNNIVFTMPPGTFNSKPVVEAQNNYNNNSLLYLIVWDQDYLNSSSNPGLHYRCLEKNSSGNYNFINTATKISNTDASSTNPTLAAKNDHTSLHLAWEQSVGSYSSEIRYYKIDRSAQNTLSFTSYYVPSAGGSYYKNYSPTMTVVYNGGMYIAWVGKHQIGEDPTLSRVVLRCRHYYNYWYSTFYQYGTRVDNVSINSAEVINQYYYGLSWVENGSTNYYKAATISGIQTLNTTGNYVQLANGLGSVNYMQAMTFKNTSVPYAFTVSETFGTGLGKASSTQDIEGREGIVSYPSKDNEEFERYYFTISDINVDGKPIKFVELHDTVMVKNIDDLNKYLTTESFELSSLSELSYNASFGLADGDKETKQITNGKKVKFRVELVGAEDKKVLGVYEQVDFKSGTNESKNKNTYKITPNIKKNGGVSLRLVVEDDDKGQYLIGSILSKSNVLGKEGAVEIVNSGNLIVEEYQLTQNYPNPFNPQTTINYQLPKDGLVTLKVYDALGKEVTELVNGYKGAGSYNVTFDGSNLASGIYFYKITAGEFTTTKKLMLMK